VIDPDSVAPTLVFLPVFFYILYGVIRAAVRGGILQADERRRIVLTSAAAAQDEHDS